MKNVILFMMTAIFFVGCGGSKSSNTGGGGATPPPSSNVDMEVGQSYSVYSGNSIVENTEDALLTIVHIDGGNDSTVTLEQGSATILRN